MAKYKYLKQQPLAFTLPDGTEIILAHENSYELPENNDYIRGLVEQGYLRELEGIQEPQKAAKRGRKTT